MSLSTMLTDDVIAQRPFQLADASTKCQAVYESLTELKPWMSWAHDGYAKHETEEFIRLTRAR